jgi:hypothetical protein
MMLRLGLNNAVTKLYPFLAVLIFMTTGHR